MNVAAVMTPHTRIGSASVRWPCTAHPMPKTTRSTPEGALYPDQSVHLTAAVR